MIDLGIVRFHEIFLEQIKIQKYFPLIITGKCSKGKMGYYIIYQILIFYK